MSITTKYSVAVLTAVFVAATASQVMAQTVKKIKNRNEAIKFCTELVRTKIGANTNTSMERTNAWKACMTQAGHRP